MVHATHSSRQPDWIPGFRSNEPGGPHVPLANARGSDFGLFPLPLVGESLS